MKSAQLVKHARELLKRGDFVGVYDAVQSALEFDRVDPTLAHLAILSLARSGAANQAMDLFHKLKSALPETEETLTLQARLFKDEFSRAANKESRRDLGRKARDIYLRAYQIRRNYYPAINAATLSFLTDDAGSAKSLAEEVIGICEATPLSGTEADYYVYVTHAEACLILRQDEKVPRLLQEARQINPGNYGNLSTTFRQLTLICDKRQIGLDLIEPIRPPTVITYTGQMIHGLGKSPGIDPADEPALRDQIRALLEKHIIKIAFGSLACGADLLVAEEVLKYGGELNLILPFSKDEFKDISVSPAGSEWDDRFEKAFEKAASVSYIVDNAYTDMDILFEACSLQGMGMAHLRSQILGSNAYQIALWNGLPGINKAGTKGAIERWQKLGLKNLVLKVPKPRFEGKTARGNKETGKVELKRQMKAMIFADVKGYSGLKEKQLPEFVSQWLEQLRNIADSDSKQILYLNTWGDAIFMVVDTVSAAAKIALGLAAFFPDHQLEQMGLPRTLGLRVAAHIGPIFETPNPVTGLAEFFGTHVIKTARLEPCTPVRSVYVTEPFAAMASIECHEDYRCEYVGNQPLPKHSGNIRMYNLTPKNSFESP